MRRAQGRQGELRTNQTCPPNRGPPLPRSLCTTGPSFCTHTHTHTHTRAALACSTSWYCGSPFTTIGTSMSAPCRSAVRPAAGGRAGTSTHKGGKGQRQPGEHRTAHATRLLCPVLPSPQPTRRLLALPRVLVPVSAALACKRKLLLDAPGVEVYHYALPAKGRCVDDSAVGGRERWEMEAAAQCSRSSG